MFWLYFSVILHKFINNGRKLGLWENENEMESGLFTGCFYIGYYFYKSYELIIHRGRILDT